MKKMFIFICIIGIIHAYTPPETLWTKTYGGSYSDGAKSIQKTTDGGYIIAGYTKSFGSGNIYYDVYLIKTDQNGDTLWTRTYGGTGGDLAHSVQQTYDGGYIIAGETNSYGAGGRDIYIIKTDMNSNILWTQTYGEDKDDVAKSIQQTSDSGYIITGVHERDNTGQDIFLLKIDNSGNIIWAKIFPGDSMDIGHEVRQTFDGGYIIAGGTNSFSSGGPNRQDVYLIRTDQNGDIIWTKIYGSDENHEEARSVQQTSDGGFIITGGFRSPYSYSDVYLIKTDQNGDTLWTKTFDGDGLHDMGLSIQQTFDGGYIIAGWSLLHGERGYDIYLIRTNENGDTLWTKTLGGNGWDLATSLAIAGMREYVIAGKTYSFGSGHDDVYLIKLRGFVQGVEEPVTSEKDYILLQNSYFQGKKVVLNIILSEKGMVSLEVYNPTGRIIATPLKDRYLSAGLNRIPFELETNGIYFYQIKSCFGNKKGKLVILK